MKKPSERELELEGLSLEKYSALDGHSRDFVDTRINLYRMFEDARIAAEFMQIIAKDEGIDKAEAILAGEDVEGVHYVKNLILAYRGGGFPDVPTAYPQLKSKVVVSTHEKQPQDLQAQESKKAIHEKQGLETPSDTTRNSGGHEFFGEQKKGSSGQDMQMNVAGELARWQGSTREKVLESDKDVIKHILRVAKEHKVDEVRLVKACESMISDEFHDAQFHLECLLPDHREELLKRVENL